MIFNIFLSIFSLCINGNILSVLTISSTFTHINIGPFNVLNAEDLDAEVTEMWRTVYKLSKTFSDQVGPRRSAESVRGKIDKFKQHLPILHTICNPGIRDRHWERVRAIFLFDLIIIQWNPFERLP